MIGFEHYVSGDQIGRKLVDDAEEMSYALKAMAEDAGKDLGEDLAGYLRGDHPQICKFLRTLADQIEVSCA